MNDRGARFIVLLLGDPEILEGTQGSQDGTSNPYGIFALWWCNDLDLYARGRQGSKFFLQAIGDTRVHCGSSRKNDVSIQFATNIEVTFVDGGVPMKKIESSASNYEKNEPTQCHEYHWLQVRQRKVGKGLQEHGT